MRFPRSIPVILGLAIALAGCKTQTAKAPGKSDSGEYVYYTPTGSNIPVKIRKSDLQTDQTETNNARETIRQVQTLQNTKSGHE